MKPDKSLTSGSTVMLVLELLSTGDMYGYQMIETLERRSENVFKLKAGTLYPLLHNLEQQGAVSSYDGEPEGARPRRYYSLTGKGLNMLKDKRAEWKIFVEAVGRVAGNAQEAWIYSVVGGVRI